MYFCILNVDHIIRNEHIFNASLENRHRNSNVMVESSGSTLSNYFIENLAVRG